MSKQSPNVLRGDAALDDDHYEIMVTFPREALNVHIDISQALVPDWLILDLVDRISYKPIALVTVNNEADLERAISLALKARSFLEFNDWVKDDKIEFKLVWPTPNQSLPPRLVNIAQVA